MLLIVHFTKQCTVSKSTLFCVLGFFLFPNKTFRKKIDPRDSVCVCVCVCVHPCVCTSVCVCVCLSLASDSSQTIIKFGMVTASEKGEASRALLFGHDGRLAGCAFSAGTWCWLHCISVQLARYTHRTGNSR